ncbi:uncharacterized protein cd93 [Salminus brasiliensis]|uniref:uncharacterized protein cd93 n=1 Tax=Salminus brasiliensis TaxID=930266 RepID=UPI003B83547B
MRALLLALWALVAAWRATGQEVTRCTARACFTLHKEKAPFHVANTRCFDNGGYLLTMRDKEEAEDARALLALASKAGLFARGEERLWLGLKLAKGSCVLDGEPLRGFRWKSNENDSSAFTNWAREPRSTCTEERCVSVRAVANAETARLDWSDGSCKESAFYACRFQFRGMCEPLALAGPGEVNYTTPFSSMPLHEGDSVRMLPHGTLADIHCASSDDPYSYIICKDAGSGAGFAWTIPGPFCASAERSCARQNGGCQHVCSENGPEGVRCSCREGYYLGEDTITCFSRDVCKNAPCEHECVVVGASFLCACNKGYRLEQETASCVDVNECEQNVCGVHVCHNQPGSYECVCEKGYRKDAGGACVDVDECAEGACERRANCLNSQGSFSCYCSTGFRQSDAGGGCVDVDECVSRPCEDICTNTVGSFACSCRANFRLADNGISCVQVVEPSSRAPASHQPSSEAPEETTATTAVTVVFSTESTSTEAEGTESRQVLSRSWLLVCVLGSVIPLLLLVALISVITVLRWTRARKDAKKKSAAVDSYCWVSSGFQVQPDIEPMDCFARQTVFLFLVLIPLHVGQALQCACTKDFTKCASIHETPADFQSAWVQCRALGGELMRAGTALSNDTIAALLNSADGSFWAWLGTKGNPRCLSVSRGKKWSERPCEERLSGFVCGGVRWDTTCWGKLVKKPILLRDGDCSMAPCDHICDDVRNGYTCTCMKEFRPTGRDPRRCEYHCLTATCKPLLSGSICPNGFVLDEGNCTDIDECKSNHNCAHTCTNTIGSYECSCLRDHILVNGSACVPPLFFTEEPGLTPPPAVGDLFITPAVNYTSGQVALASPGEYVGITVFIIAALVGVVLLVRYLRTRKTERLKDCDVLDNVSAGTVGSLEGTRSHGQTQGQRSHDHSNN